jgi:ribosome modulation factor
MLTAAQGDPRAPSLRILLLARSAGEWWQQLQDSSPDKVIDLIAGHLPIKLGAVAGRSGQNAVFAEAMIAFAALRGIPCPNAVLRLADTAAVGVRVGGAGRGVLQRAGGGLVGDRTGQRGRQDGLVCPSRPQTLSATCPWTAGNSRTHWDLTGRRPAKRNSPRGRENPGHGLFRWWWQVLSKTDGHR